MATYLSGIIGIQNGLKETHFSGLTCFGNGTTKQEKIKLYISQWEFIRHMVCYKGFKQVFISYLQSVEITTVEKLVALLNTPVTNSSAKIPYNSPKEALKGPMLLPYLIDYMWLLILEPVPRNLIKSYVNMYDPLTDIGPTGSMLSSGGKLGFNIRGIAFRGDTRSYEQFTSNGFTARFSEPPGHPFHVPQVYGTVAAEGMAFDRSARDFANQTGVCVARNIIGSMKFVGARDDEDKIIRKEGYIYAIKFHEGVDTEQMQLDKILSGALRTTLWRAGEKAARQIPKWRFIASCKFEVDEPYSSLSKQTFKFRRLTDWVFYRVGSEDRAYILLSTARMPLNQWQNFTATDDWASEG